MYNHFFNPYQPDQGYYTQQPATVDQVNNLWEFIKLMRGELTRAIKDFNAIDAEYVKNDEYELAKNELDLIEKTVNTLDARLKLAEKGVNIFPEEIANIVSIIDLHKDEFNKFKENISQEIDDINASAIKALSFTSDDNKLSIDQTTVDNQKANIANIDLVNGDIRYLPSTIEKDIKVLSIIDGNKFANSIKIEDGKVLYKDNVLFEYDDDISEYVNVVNDGKTLKIDETKLKSIIEHLTNSIDTLEIYFTINDDSLNIYVSNMTATIDYEFSIKLGKDFYFSNINENDVTLKLHSPLQRIDQINASTISTEKNEAETRLISKNTTYMYDTVSDKYKQYGEPYNETLIKFINTPSDNEPVYIKRVDDKTLTIDSSQLQNRIESYYTSLIDASYEQDKELLDLKTRLTTLENTSTRSVVDADFDIKPNTDTLELELTKYFSDGTTEKETKAIRLLNQDHSLQFNTSLAGTENTTNIHINHDKKWLSRQGLKTDMEVE